MKHLTPTQAYLISFILLAMWAIFAYATMQNQIHEQERYAKLINISGKQRMLSQRTTLLASQYLQTGDMSYMEELKKCRSLMEKDHQFLTKNLPSEDLRTIYYETPYLLNSKVISYFDLLQSYIDNNNSYNSEYLVERSSQLLPDLDSAVKAYEQESDKKNAQLTKIEGYILLGTILTLILEALLILKPTIKKATLNMAQLENMVHDKTRKLTQSLEELKREIAAKEQAEEALSRSYEVFEKLTNTAKDGIIQIDHEGNVVFWNPAATDIFGYSAKEIMGANLHQVLVPKKLREMHLKAFPEFLKTGRGDAIGKTLELEAVHKNGQSVTIELSLSSFLIDNNWQALGLIRDITDRKKAEQERLALENQLRQKYKMDSVGVMAGGMAHNFNNNLSIILGNIELSKMKMSDNPDVESYLDNAKIGVLRSRDLIQQILTYSRQGGKDKTSIHLSLIIDETLQLLRSTMPTTINLQKKISSDSHNLAINADSSQIQECLINLCNNAMHAMDEEGDLTIALDRVELQKQDIPAQYASQPGQYAKLSVQDTGSGMTAETIGKVFDLFFTTKPVGEGTGVGLSTVQGIVTQHDGVIKVDSHLGQGTTFELYFPVIDPTQPTETADINTDMPEGAEHLLFVDDDPMLASLGEQMLKTKGYTVTTMTDSIEALKLFTANADRIDLVITDQTMPELTGKDLILKLKEIRPDIPTIICTGYSSKIDEEAAIELEASAFLMKPLDLPTLLQTVRQVLDGES